MSTQACEEKLGKARVAELRAKSDSDSALFLVATLKARVAQLESLVFPTSRSRRGCRN